LPIVSCRSPFEQNHAETFHEPAFSGSSSAELRLRRQIKEHETRMIWG
jgi:hypothetical protein